MLNASHRNTPDFSVIVPAALLAEQRRTQRIFEVVMVALASISLLVGGIGIMNIMLASILERTREIGVRRALGARRADIVRQFLIETILISFVGGTIGVIVGVGISQPDRPVRGLVHHCDGELDSARVPRVGLGRPRVRSVPRSARRASGSDRSSSIRVALVEALSRLRWRVSPLRWHRASALSSQRPTIFEGITHAALGARTVLHSEFHDEAEGGAPEVELVEREADFLQVGDFDPEGAVVAQIAT